MFKLNFWQAVLINKYINLKYEDLNKIRYIEEKLLPSKFILSQVIAELMVFYLHFVSAVFNWYLFIVKYVLTYTLKTYNLRPD